MKDKIRRYSYSELDTFSRAVATQIIRTGKTFDVLLAIMKEGLFVAHLFSYFLHIETVHMIGFNEDNSFSAVPNPLLLAQRNVLIVDIAVRNMTRFHLVGDFLIQGLMERHNVSYATAALLCSKDLVLCKHTPGFYAEGFDGDVLDPIFPWTR